MTDVTTKTTTPATTAPEQLVHDPVPASDAQTAPKTADNNIKTKGKPKRRTRQRRRAAASDNESSANEGGNQSDSSASFHSDHVDSEDEDEQDPEVVEAKQPSVFPDVSSITPAGWTKRDENQESISFEDFEAGKEPPAAVPARGTGLSIRGRGKGKVEAGQKREFTPEETAKYEAQKAKRKEKQKVKKAELREKAKDKAAKGKEAPKATEADVPVKEPSSTVIEKPASKPTPQSTKSKAKKQTEPAPAPSRAVSEVTASTSAIKLDTPASESATPVEAEPSKAESDEPAVESQRGVELLPDSTIPDQDSAPRGSKGNQREAYAQRMAEDPKFTPRVGQFWTHDQRLNEGGNVGDGHPGLRQMSPFWRGRGVPRGAFRGVIRGRGRGGFFPNAHGGRGGAVHGQAHTVAPRPVELSAEQPTEEGGSKLAMDREYELAEAREKAKSTTQAAVPIDTPESETATPVVRPPVAPMADRKWGHEAFETMGNGDQFRGRGRGRVMRARGGHFPRVHHLPFHPSAIAARAAAAGLTPPATAAPQTAAEPEVASAPKAEEPASGETMATQPDADSLLDGEDDSFKVKFPGSEASVVPSAPPSSSVPPAAPVAAETAAAPAAPATVAKEVSHEAQYPTINSSSPGPVAAFQAQMYTGGSSSNSPFPNGSENGSAGSGHYNRHPGQFYAPGMNASGEFVPSHMQAQPSPQYQRPPFHPAQSRPHMPNQYYSPQHHPSSPYSPGPYDSNQAGPSYVGGGPMGSPQGFYPGQANGFANGRSSPLNPYMANNNQVGGYFSPARSASKVAIRAPISGEQAQGQSNGTPPPSQANGHQHQQQQQQQGSTYYPQHYNPYVQPFVPQQQQRQETVYYQTPNDQQYGWQGQGYGDQGYYDANGAYGY